MPTTIRHRPYRKRVIALAIAFAFNQSLVSVAAAQTTSSAPGSFTPSDNSTVLSTAGTSNTVTGQMNKAASYATDLRLQLVNSLYRTPLKEPLQRMTCLDKIMAVKFGGLSSFSFSSIINSIIQAALLALMQAACSMIDQAWDSAMGKLNEMTTVNLGSNVGSASLVNGSSGSVSVSPTFNSTNPYVSDAINAAGNNAGTSSGYGGFGSALSSGWEATKNLFK